MKESGFLAALWRLVWLGVNLGAPARTGSLCETGLCLYLLFITAEQAVSSDCTAREKKRRKKVISVYCTSASMLLSLYNATEIIQGNLVDDSPSHAELLKLKGANNHVFSLRCCFWKVFKTYCCTVRFMHSLDTTSHSYIKHNVQKILLVTCRTVSQIHPFQDHWLTQVNSHWYKAFLYNKSQSSSPV